MEASRGFKREDRLVVEGELCIEFAETAIGDDRVTIGNYDLHDLISSQFSESADQVQRLGNFRLVMERIV